MSKEPKKYTLKKEIGSGSFGKVYLSEDPTTGKEVAIKRLKKSIIDKNPYFKEALYKEINIMSQIRSQHSVQFIECIESESNYNIIMEKCDTDLDTILIRKRGFSVQELKVILLQLNDVFKTMKDLNIIHRDIKLKNILVKYTNEEHTKFDVKLSDFGFSKVMDDTDSTSTICGTPVTMAPELLEEKKYTYKADLWSVGVIAYQLLYCTYPYLGSKEQIRLKVKKGLPKVMPEDPVLKDLLSKLLTYDPNKRISWEEYFNHPFFSNSNDCNSDTNSNKRYKFIKKFETGINTGNFKCGIYEDTYDRIKVFAKLYSNDVVESHKEDFNKELQLMQLFKGFENCLQLKEVTRDKYHTFIICEYFEGEAFVLYAKQNQINEDFIKKINYNLFSNFLSYAERNNIIFNIITPYNFIIDTSVVSQPKMFIYDFGFIRNILEPNVNQFYYNTLNYISINPSVKSNVLNYGMTLYKIISGVDEVYTINEKGLKLPNDKKITKQFVYFLSKCINKSENKRYTFSSFARDNFVIDSLKSKHTHKEVFSKERLETIKNKLYDKYSNIIDIFKNINLKDSLYSPYLKEIVDLLLMFYIELSIYEKIFSHNKAEKYSQEEELSLILVYNSKELKTLQLNLGELNMNYKIYDEDSINIVSQILYQIKTYIKEIINITKPMLHVTKKIYTKMSYLDFFKYQIENFHSKEKIKFITNINNNGYNLFKQNKLKEAQISFKLVQYFIEFLIPLKLCAMNKNNGYNNIKMMEEYFNDYSNDVLFSKMQLNSTTLEKCSDNTFFMTSLGSMFKAYVKKENPLNISQSLINPNSEYLNNLLKLYSIITKLIKDCN